MSNLPSKFPDYLRNPSDPSPDTIKKPQNPWNSIQGGEDSATRDVVPNYRFMSETPYIRREPEHRTAHWDNDLIQQKYELGRMKANAPQFISTPLSQRPSMELPEQPLNDQEKKKQVFGSTHPDVNPTLEQQKEDFDAYHKTGRRVIHEQLKEEQKKKQLHGGVVNDRPDAGTPKKFQRMIQKTFETAEADEEGEDEPVSSDKLEKTLPLTEQRGNVIQLKQVIQEISNSLSNLSASSLTSLRPETLNNAIRTLESEGSKIKKQSLQDMRKLLEPALQKLGSQPQLWTASGATAKVRLILIMYIYILKLLQTYQNKNRTSMLEVYMEDLIDSNMATLISFLDQLRSWSKLTNKNIQNLSKRASQSKGSKEKEADKLKKEIGELKKEKKDLEKEDKKTKTSQPGASASASAQQDATALGEEETPAEQEAEGGGLIKDLIKSRKKTKKREKQDQNKGFPSSKQSKQNFAQMDKILDSPPKKGKKAKKTSMASRLK